MITHCICQPTFYYIFSVTFFANCHRVTDRHNYISPSNIVLQKKIIQEIPSKEILNKSTIRKIMSESCTAMLKPTESKEVSLFL